MQPIDIGSSTMARPRLGVRWAQAMTAVPSAGFRRATIAIVDDDEDVRQSVGDLVESLGFEAATFETGDDLIASDRLGEMFCVVTDLQMRGRNGLEIARHVLKVSTVPVILITAYPAPGLSEQAMAIGVRRLLRKPFDPAVLIDELEEMRRTLDDRQV